LNPSPAAIALIDTYVTGLSGGWAGNTDSQILAAINAPVTANRTAQGTVPATFTADSILSSGVISAASVAKLLALPSYDSTVIPLLNQATKSATDVTNLNGWATAYFMAGALQQSEFDALAAPAPHTTAGVATGLFNQTVADPTYQSQLSWAQVNLGRPADENDIATVRASS
jgi:hypothetical protein